MSDVGTVYSLGTEALTLEEQLSILVHLGVHCVLDVRNASETKSQSRIEMKEFFYINQIHYRDYSGYLSMDTTERKFLTSQGYMDFQKYTESLNCKEAMTRIERGAAKGYACCLLGYHADPAICHRSILAGHELLKRDIDVQHIIKAGTMSQSLLEHELVDQECPSLDQIALFDVPQTPYEEKLTETIRRRNKLLGQTWLQERNQSYGKQTGQYRWGK